MRQNNLWGKVFTVTILIIFLMFGIAFSDDDNDAPKQPKGYPAMWMLKAAYATGMLKLVNTEPQVPDEITEIKDIVYKTINDDTLGLDIYQPAKLESPKPVLIFIHGGGWRKGKKEDYLYYLLHFAQQGYITATISYRLKTPFPAAVEDVKCAVRWIRAHAAEYSIDPNKIAVIGGSAGGHLSMMVGYSSDVPDFDIDCDMDSISSKPQAIVNLYGPVDLTTEYAHTHKLTVNFIGQTWEENPDAYKKASPISYITPDDPPTLTFHGTKDELVPIRQADMLQEKLEEAGVENEYHRLKWWPHTMDLAKPVNDYCLYYMQKFFEKHVPIQ